MEEETIACSSSEHIHRIRCLCEKEKKRRSNIKFILRLNFQFLVVRVVFAFAWRSDHDLQRKLFFIFFSGQALPEEQPLSKSNSSNADNTLDVDLSWSSLGWTPAPFLSVVPRGKQRLRDATSHYREPLPPIDHLCHADGVLVILKCCSSSGMTWRRCVSFDGITTLLRMALA